MKIKHLLKKATLFGLVGSLLTVAAVSFSGSKAVAEYGTSDEESLESVILSQQDAVLQKYSIEDLIATQSFLLNKPYDGTGRVVDANEDGCVDAFDMCIMRKEYKETGNYYDLLFKFMQNTEDQYSIASEDGALISNRVIVQGTHELEFSEFSPVSVLGDSEYYYLLQFDSFSDAKNCIAVLENEEGVICAQMDGYVETPPDENEQFSMDLLEIESSSLSWGVSVIEADKYASYLSKNYSGQVTVAVIDTGVSKHSLLNNRLLSGRDIVNNDNDPSDDQGHGTHVAGTIVDCTPGLNINIMPIKVLDASGSGSDAQVIAGIKWARQNHVDVINLSLGPYNRVPTGGAFEYAINQAVAEGITVVKAAGNENDDTKYHSPSNASAPIVVASIDSSLTRASSSNYGASVDLSAPGVRIKSSTYDGGYGYKSGTSMAAPHIAAAAAMVKYQYPSYTPAQVESTLTNICMDLGSTGKDFYYGYGVPKLSKLIKAQVTPTITLSAKNAILYKGQKYTLSASVTPGDVDVKWTTSNSSVATVSNGVVTANGTGNATITAFFTYNGTNYSATCSITVKNPGITLSETSKTVYQTNTFNLTASVLPAGQTVFWSTSNSNVVIVSNGRVTAVNPGTATIMASITYKGETYSSSCKVTVKEVSVKLDQTSKTVYQTDEFTLTATATPSGQTVSWSSSDSSIAKVSNGKITAVNPGTAKITASFVYGGKTFSAVCTVTVKKVSLELNAHSKSLIIGDTSTLTATTSPPGLTVTWESSNNMVASVSSGKITANAPGNITIKAAMTYNGKEYSDSCTVTVVEPSVKISKSQLKISKNETFILTADTLPSGRSITWKSEDTNICTISSTGQVKGVAIGNTMVYATITYGGQTYTDKCNVIVGEPKITLNKTSMTMNKGDVESLIASVIAVDGVDISSETRSDISWTSSNTNIATVDNNGSVKAVTVGEATITAKYTFCGISYTATCKVCVPEIKLSSSSLSLYIGDTYALTKTVTPSSASVSWSSSNTSVATVDSNGKVAAKGEGSATITAKFTYDGNTYSATCTVVVNKPGVTVNPTSKTIYLGDSFTISATIKSGGQTITWSSSNTSVATVDLNGKVTAKGAGTATITAKFTYAGTAYSATCAVTVEKPSISFSPTSKSVYVTDSFTISATVKPSGQTITWSSSNTSVATVDSSGKVTAKGTGSATITGKFTYNGNTYSATCSVTVQGKPGITLNKSSLSLYIGDTNTLVPAVTPSGSTVTWSSSNTSVATVNSSGKVSAISNGTATITASIRYNGVTYYVDCKVTVTKPSISVSISSSKIWLGDTTYVSKSGNIPSGVTVSWISSNSSIATVNSSGTVTGMGNGTATITGSFTYGGNKYSSSATVSVITTNSVRTIFVSPTSGSNGSTVFEFNANVGFAASKVTLQVCSTEKSLQSNGTYDYTTYTNEFEMSKKDASHWIKSSRFNGFSAGTYLVRCRAYNGSSSVTAYVSLTIK